MTVVQSASVSAVEQMQPCEPCPATVKQQLYVDGQAVNGPPGAFAHAQAPFWVSSWQVQPEPPPVPPPPIVPPLPPVPVPIWQAGIVWPQASAAAQSDMFRHS